MSRDPISVDALERRFLRLWESTAGGPWGGAGTGPPGDPLPPGRGREPPAATRAQAHDAARVWSTLRSLYGLPERHYHTLGHIALCLEQLDRVQRAPPLQRAHDPLALELALWFHDAVYEPAGCDNERRSMALFTQLSGTAMPAELRSRVCRLIEVTIHPSEPVDEDERLMVDIDLFSFGRPWPRFLRDSVNVRREARHLGEVEYLEKQLEFVSSLLGAGGFFRSHYFRARYEEQALANIARYEALVARRLLARRLGA